MTQGIPKQEAAMKVKIEDLRNLPEGAKYRNEEGRTSVEAERHGNRIVIRAQCDSIARECIFYKNTASEQQKTIDSLTNEIAHHRQKEVRLEAEMKDLNGVISDFEQKRKPPNLWFLWLIVGCVAGSALMMNLSKSSLVKKVFKL